MLSVRVVFMLLTDSALSSHYALQVGNEGRMACE